MTEHRELRGAKVEPTQSITKLEKPEMATIIMEYDMGKPYTVIAKEHKRDKQTVRKVIENRDELGFPVEESLNVLHEIIEDKKKSIISDAFQIMDKANKRVLSTIDKASAAQAATIFGIYYDKMQHLVKATEDQPDEDATFEPTKEEWDIVVRAAKRKEVIDGMVNSNTVDVEEQDITTVTEE